ncbi:DUF6501 family protein [Metabacillus niabensis]|uniref:Uncharacterized protein n=1 Tax=Metabacillus niabensis TaxID=324854 RepID=A0ABT9YZ38_9BACI|nr:DUF6501 family protein [Metabacillus niabensis]MDQ0225266.1 hypothetical protein [Metabacillus niabensis]PAD68122.1 hypothetical protein CHH83_15105 [Bacillus sp. 7586-K]
MIHKTWQTKQPVKKVTCIHTNAKKYVVKNVLTVGNQYDVQNETEEFYFVIDNTGKVGGFYKEYFEEQA